MLPIVLIFGLMGCVNLRAGIYNDLQFPPQKPLCDPKTALITSLLDPRAGVALNSGYQLSPGEKFRLIPYFGLFVIPFQAIEAGRGVTETEFCYYRGLDSLAATHNIGLAALLRASDKLSSTESKSYIKYIASTYPAPQVLLFADDISDLNPNSPSTGENNWLLQHWPGTSGPSLELLEMALNHHMITDATIQNYFSQISAYESDFPLPPNYYLIAEKYNSVDTLFVNNSLKRRFWKIYQWAIEDRETAPRLRWRHRTPAPEKLALEKALMEIHLSND